jgi:hypothetical protein
MKGTKLILLLFVFMGVLSCKKKESTLPIRTILPLPYFPVYPGSYWVYVGTHNDSIYSTTNPTYILHSYPYQGTMTDPVYVPFLDGNPIYGYATPFPNMYGDPNTWIHQILLSDVLGFSFPQVNVDPQFPHTYSNLVTAVGQTDTVNGIIYSNVVVNTRSVTGYSPSPWSVLKKHFARDIGLIKVEGLDTSYHWITTQTLVRYHINR